MGAILTIVDPADGVAGRMESTGTAHKAIGITANTWYVSWLPAEPLSRNAAITAMTLAEVAAALAITQGETGSNVPDDPRWIRLSSYAQELGLTEDRAFVLATTPPPAADQAERDHAVGDEPDHLTAFFALNPQPGEPFVGDNGATLFAFVGQFNLELIDANGETYPASVAAADFGPLTRAHIVPADAIVLPAADPEGEALLQDAGYVIDPSNANRIVGVKGRRIELLTGHCDHCGDQAVTEFSPGAARRLAGLLALAADEAERGQG